MFFLVCDNCMYVRTFMAAAVLDMTKDIESSEKVADESNDKKASGGKDG